MARPSKFFASSPQAVKTPLRDPKRRPKADVLRYLFFKLWDGATWAHLGPSWCHLGPSWAHLGSPWGHLLASLDHLAYANVPSVLCSQATDEGSSGAAFEEALAGLDGYGFRQPS